MPSFIHSWSTIEKFEQCPRQFEQKYVLKIKEPPSTHMDWGNQVHTAMEDRIRGTLDTPLPEGMEKFEKILDATRIAKQAGLTVLAEQKIAMDRSGVAVDFWSKQAWVRGKVDLTILGEHHAEQSDYKTGKWKSSKEQMRLTAWMSFHHWPRLERIQTRYHWLQGGDQNCEVHSRERMHVLAGNFNPRIIRIENALASGHFDATPNGLCEKHCPVLSCEYNGRS